MHKMKFDFKEKADKLGNEDTIEPKDSPKE